MSKIVDWFDIQKLRKEAGNASGESMLDKVGLA